MFLHEEVREILHTVTRAECTQVLELPSKGTLRLHSTCDSVGMLMQAAEDDD